MKTNKTVFLVIMGCIVLAAMVYICIQLSKKSKSIKKDPRLNQYGDLFNPSIDQTGLVNSKGDISNSAEL